MKYYLAVDIGASSGRHIVGWEENGEIRTEEVFRNGWARVSVNRRPVCFMYPGTGLRLYLSVCAVVIRWELRILLT